MVSYAQVKSIFMSALEKPVEERDAFLASSCPADVRREVESLLKNVTDDAVIATVPLAAPRDPLGLVGRKLGARFCVDEHVADGGFGVVYRASSGDGGVVAIKAYRPQLLLDDEDQNLLREAFQKEALLLRVLAQKSPAIVRCFDVDNHTLPSGEVIPYMALEWLEGRTLAEILRVTRQPWPIARMIDLLTPIADALDIAHAAGVAHRDIKPANVFVVEKGVPTLKLLDFGVAKVAAERTRGFHSTGGQRAAFTLAYAAPEQLTKDVGATGPWTDVYGLALLCVELLSGRRPYDEDDLSSMFRLNDRVRRTPRALGVKVKDDVEATFATALAVKPADRFQSVSAFWRALTSAA